MSRQPPRKLTSRDVYSDMLMQIYYVQKAWNVFARVNLLNVHYHDNVIALVRRRTRKQEIKKKDK